MNKNNEAGQCICSFSYGTDRVHVFEMPDENVGFISGWIFCFNNTPYFYDIMGGSEGLDAYIANTYAVYLASHLPENAELVLDCEDSVFKENIEANMAKLGVERDIANEGWILNDDTSIDFNNTFVDAMEDAGFKRREDGGWERKTKGDDNSDDPCESCPHLGETTCANCRFGGFDK